MKSQMDKLYEETDESLENQFRQKTLNDLVIKYIKGRTVFEVGCGSGTLIKVLLKNGYNASGCDYSKTQYRLARNRLFKEGFNTNVIHNISLEKTIDWDKKFDTVICLDVLEHIQNDKLAFKQLLRLVKKNGRLIILVPAFMQFWTNRDVKYGHHRRYTKNTLRHLLADNKSVKIIALRYWNLIGAIATWLLIRLNLRVDTDRIVSKREFPATFINWLFGLWLRNIEKHIIFPFGLSLLGVFERV